jgi:LEA14-like dessication related protein
MRSLFSLICMSLVVVLAGCSTPPEKLLAPPVVQVTGLSIAADTYLLTLRLANANTVPLVAKKSTHTLVLGDQRISRIDDKEPIGIPPLGQIFHTIKLPAAQASEVRAWLAKNPGDIRASVETVLTITIGYVDSDDTVKLTGTGRGTLKAP